ncbi:MAG: hypothetical protein FWE37_05385 [Spirochaetaceae bacterium]|nr:hypothetical protein [Spirochaetaceae bacterium]
MKRLILIALLAVTSCATTSLNPYIGTLSYDIIETEAGVMIDSDLLIFANNNHTILFSRRVAAANPNQVLFYFFYLWSNVDFVPHTLNLHFDDEIVIIQLDEVHLRNTRGVAAYSIPINLSQLQRLTSLFNDPISTLTLAMEGREFNRRTHAYTNRIYSERIVITNADTIELIRLNFFNNISLGVPSGGMSGL